MLKKISNAINGLCSVLTGRLGQKGYSPVGGSGHGNIQLIDLATVMKPREMGIIPNYAGSVMQRQHLERRRE